MPSAEVSNALARLRRTEANPGAACRTHRGRDACQSGRGEPGPARGERRAPREEAGQCAAGRQGRALSDPRALATAVAIFLAALVCFRDLLGGVAHFMPGDHRVHLLFALGTLSDPVPHPLFHETVLLTMRLAGESYFDGARRCAAVVLALAVAVRGWLTHRELAPTLPPAEAAVACFALAVAMSLPNWWNFPAIYSGQIHPNVWHNPTTIFAAPFAVLVFLAAMRYWEAPGLGPAAAVGLWSAMCALAKPNFLLAFAPCFGPLFLALLARQLWRGQLTPSGAFARLVAAFAPPLWVLALQYLCNFGDGARVVWQPLGVWRAVSRNVPASAALGLAFPLVAAACYPRQLAGDRRALFAWAVLAVAVAEFGLLAERSDASAGRYYAGNFVWALMPASYLLFVESCRLIGRQGWGNRATVCAAVLGLHAASGTFYLVRCLRVPGDCVRF
jgi:hypothetical protein